MAEPVALCSSAVLALTPTFSYEELLHVLTSMALGWLCFSLCWAKLTKAAGTPASEAGDKGPLHADGGFEVREAQQALSEGGNGFVTGLARLPGEVCAEVSRWMPLESVVSAAAACHDLQGLLWDAPEVWCSRAADKGLLPPFGAAVGLDGCLLREAYRMDVFSISTRRLKALGEQDPAIVLEAASRAVRGAMPRDGLVVLEGLHALAMQALQGCDPRSLAAAGAADDFLRVARRRVDLWAKEQLEQLEDAFSNASHFQAPADSWDLEMMAPDLELELDVLRLGVSDAVDLVA